MNERFNIQYIGHPNEPYSTFPEGRSKSPSSKEKLEVASAFGAVAGVYTLTGGLLGNEIERVVAGIGAIVATGSILHSGYKGHRQHVQKRNQAIEKILGDL